MKFQSNQFEHNQADKIGVLITNLGTPEAPTRKALRIYLREFLSDPRVVEVPRLIWQIILNLFILTTRPQRSAAAYQRVWTEKGSPLLLHSQNQLQAIKQKFTSQSDEQLIFELGMRYGEPSIHKMISRLLDQGARKIVVLPLYPQYSASTTASTFDALAKDFKQRRWLPELRFVNQYFDHQKYIEACAEKIRQSWQQNGRKNILILSYHGLPKRYLESGDPYFCQCHKTSRLIAEALSLREEEYMTCFQSRFGKEEWLQPYTDITLKSLAEKGINSVEIFCPGFAADCLETIEEIGIENRNYFLQAGGTDYQFIESLNDDEMHIDALVNIIQSNIKDWQSATENDNKKSDLLTQRKQRALKMGARN